MTEPNIQYGLTKQRTSQSMKTRGTLASYEILDKFLRAHTEDLTYKKSKLNYFIWAGGKETVKNANKLEKQLFSEYGKQKKRATRFSLFKNNYHYEEMFKIVLEGEVRQHLEYIDSLGKLPGLTPRPPIDIVVTANFWLKGAEKTDIMKSRAMAWLSPTSNSVDLLLNFPDATADDHFAQSRAELQADCPVPLEDRYFYIRKPTKSGSSYTFRKVFKD